MEKTGPRRDYPPVKVYGLPDERAQLQGDAEAANISASTYLLSLGLAESQGKQDAQWVHEGDMGLILDTLLKRN